jgi:hypothetical protein
LNEDLIMFLNCACTKWNEMCIFYYFIFFEMCILKIVYLCQ